MSDQNKDDTQARETGSDTMGHASEGSGAVHVAPVSFDELLPAEGDSGRPAAITDSQNLGLILDVDVPVSVVLGNVRKSIGEIVSLTEGQVIDLERGAGEPVDLLVNGKLVARGEVVVVDDHYGLRIAEIVAPKERV